MLLILLFLLLLVFPLLDPNVLAKFVLEELLSVFIFVALLSGQNVLRERQRPQRLVPILAQFISFAAGYF